MGLGIPLSLLRIRRATAGKPPVAAVDDAPSSARIAVSTENGLAGRQSTCQPKARARAQGREGARLGDGVECHRLLLNKAVTFHTASVPTFDSRSHWNTRHGLCGLSLSAILTRVAKEWAFILRMMCPR
jgi:hypothetical protein